jgi:hypothetical protein
MKKLLLILLLVPMVSFGQDEKIKKGKAYIIPMGKGIYQSSITGKTGFTSTGKLKTRALAKGKEFAKEKNAELEVISFETVEQSFMVFPQAIMTFRLVYETQEINNPNDPNKITITTTGNIMNNNQETTISRPPSQPSDSQKNNKKKIAIEELKELKGLLDLGLITQEEFDKKAAELKKIILGN